MSEMSLGKWLSSKEEVDILEDNADAQSVCSNIGMSDEVFTKVSSVMEKEQAHFEEEMRDWYRLRKEEDFLDQMNAEKQRNRYLGGRKGRVQGHEFPQMKHRRSESQAGREFRDHVYSQQQSDRHISGVSRSEKAVFVEGNFDEQDIFFLSLARMTKKLKSERQAQVLIKLTSFLSKLDT